MKRIITINGYTFPSDPRCFYSLVLEYSLAVASVGIKRLAFALLTLQHMVVSTIKNIPVTVTFLCIVATIVKSLMPMEVSLA
jgi:hypothetical protein